MSALKVQRGYFESPKTLSLKARPSDIFMHARPDAFGQPQEAGILDFWFFNGGEQLTVTNQSKDFPGGFELHPSEVADELAYRMIEKIGTGWQPDEPINAPNYWRLRAGDHLVVVGESAHSSGGVMVLDFIFKPCALVCWHLPDGTQPMAAEQAAMPRPFEDDPTAKQYMRYAAHAFLTAPPSSEVSCGWRIPS
jgi:hypothetical protein